MNTNPLGRFFSDPDLENVETFINGLLSTPSELNSNTSENISSEFINSFFKEEKNKSGGEDLNSILGQFSIPTERLSRYASYDEIYKSVPLIKRIINVYKPYIIQKNPVTGSWYLLRRTVINKNQTSEQLQKSEDVKKFIEDVLEIFKVGIKLKNQILHNQLVYGDCFVEVVDLNEEKSKIDIKSVNLITESLSRIERHSKLEKTSSDAQILNTIEEILNEVIQTNSGYDEEDLTSNLPKFDNTLLRFHKPHNIVILETKYGTTLGYLEITKDVSSNLTGGFQQTLTSITSRIVNVSSNRDSGIVSQDAIMNRIIGHILKKVQKDPKKFSEKTISDLKRFIIEQNIYTDKLNLKPIEVRFVPTNRMVQFNITSSEHYPFGNSLIEPLLLPGKLFILSQLSNVMHKLSRAPLSRKWIIDQGSVQMPGQLLQKLKRELKNNRIAIEDLSKFKSISKIMSDYKDHFILSKDGRRALDVEVSSVGDPSVKIADLEDNRRELISLSGIPAPYLGYMDVVELREQLVHANVSFATEIVDIQENVNAGLVKLMDIIAEVEQFELKPSEFYTISLIPPVVLILQLIEMTMSSVGNIFGIFQTGNIPFDPYYFLEKYVPYIDWTDFKIKSEEYNRKISVKTTLDQNDNPPGSPDQFR